MTSETQINSSIDTVAEKPVPESLFHSTKKSKLNRNALIGIVLAQAGLLTAVIVPKAIVFATGKTIQVHAHMYDPEDLFRGSYLNLQYDISQNKRGSVNMPHVPSESTVYATLAQQGCEYQLQEVTVDRPQLSSAEAEKLVVLKAKTNSSGSLDYGVEDIYVPSEVARSTSSTSEFLVTLSVSSAGDAVVKRVVTGGKVIYASNFF